MLDTKLEFQINPNVTDQYQSQKPADCLWPHSDPQSRVTVTYYRCYRTLCTQRSDQQHNDANGRETYTPVALITNKKKYNATHLKGNMTTQYCSKIIKFHEMQVKTKKIIYSVWGREKKNQYTSQTTISVYNIR